MFIRMRHVIGSALVAASVVLAPGCKGPMAKIEAIRDAVSADDENAIKSSVEGYPTCPEMPPAALSAGQASPRDKGCLGDIATALGSKKGFAPSPPDQAAAATVALVVLRDRRGDWIAHSDTWLASLKNGSGAGMDALRLAVAYGLAKAAPLVGRHIDDDKTASETLKAIASAIPGACPTYWLIGEGTDSKKLSAELTAEHSACVQHDLKRREGPGGTYGEGTFRALEGALALYRETERALRLGLGKASPEAKATIEKKLVVIEEASGKIATKKFTGDQPVVLNYLGDVHAEAGIVLWKNKDAGAEAGADGGDGTNATPGPAPTRMR